MNQENIANTFSGPKIDIYNYEKRDKKYVNDDDVVTGRALLLNKTRYAVVDIDIHKDLPEDERDRVRETFIENLAIEGVKIVQTANKGLHYYVRYDKLNGYNMGGNISKNAYVKIIRRLKFDIDIFLPAFDTKRQLIVLPLQLL